MNRPTIEDVKRIQADRGLCEHVVWVGEDDFVMAHTDEERATIDLTDCPLHIWLMTLAGPPVKEGYYHVVVRAHDPVSESFRGDAGRWEFKELVV